MRGLSDEYESWNTIWTWRRNCLSGSAPEPSGSPSNSISPASGRIRCMSRRAVVDLPQPDLPTTPSVSPLSTSKSMPSTARTSADAPNTPFLTGKCLTSPRTDNNGCAGPPRSGATTTGAFIASRPSPTRSPSERRLNEIEVMKIMAPGSAATQGWT